jgi:hypothetical protein
METIPFKKKIKMETIPFKKKIKMETIPIPYFRHKR